MSLTEKEKMLSGKAYQAGDPLLTKERLKARELLYQLHQLPPTQLKQRKSLLKRLLGQTSTHFYIEPPFYCDYGYNIELGERFYANFGLTILDCAPVQIGSHVFIGPHVSLFTAGHPMHAELRDQEMEWAQPIHIGDHVWIGGNVVVNPGVSIGSHSVIGSGSVVTRTIPSHVFAAGNPCRVIREITDQEKEFYYKNLKITE